MDSGRQVQLGIDGIDNTRQSCIRVVPGLGWPMGWIDARVGLGLVWSGRVGSGWVGSGQFGSIRVGSGWVGLGRVELGRNFKISVGCVGLSRVGLGRDFSDFSVLGWVGSTLAECYFCGRQKMVRTQFCCPILSHCWVYIMNRHLIANSMTWTEFRTSVENVDAWCGVVYNCTVWLVLGRKLVLVYYGLGRVQIFEFALGWVGLGWVSQTMRRVGTGHRKWTYGQL